MFFMTCRIECLVDNILLKFNDIISSIDHAWKVLKEFPLQLPSSIMCMNLKYKVMQIYFDNLCLHKHLSLFCLRNSSVIDSVIRVKQTNLEDVLYSMTPGYKV